MNLRQEQKILSSVFLDRDVLGLLLLWVDEGSVLARNSFYFGLSSICEGGSLACVGIPNIWKIINRNRASKPFVLLSLFSSSAVTLDLSQKA